MAAETLEQTCIDFSAYCLYSVKHNISIIKVFTEFHPRKNSRTIEIVLQTSMPFFLKANQPKNKATTKPTSFAQACETYTAQGTENAH